jgi:hypothetical protein
MLRFLMLIIIMLSVNMPSIIMVSIMHVTGLNIASIRKDCFQNKSKFITEYQFTKHMRVTIH